MAKKRKLGESLLKLLWEFHEGLIRLGLGPRTPRFWLDYHPQYPELRELEAAFPEIQRELLELLKLAPSITRMEDLGGEFTKGGIHKINWKAYLLKLGDFVEVNCRRCPHTYRALKKLDKAHVVFFSILFPGQYITPHFGYYRGFLRYHLALKVPAGDQCWLRINDDTAVARRRDEEPIEDGDKYFWEEGQGVMFDDTLLHDACNESDEIRVVLFADLERPYRQPFAALHGLVLRWVLKYVPIFGKFRKNAEVQGSPPAKEPAEVK